MSINNKKKAIKKILLGCNIVFISRTLNMIEINFKKNDIEYRCHIQCYFRIRQNNIILTSNQDIYKHENIRIKNPYDYSTSERKSRFDHIIKNKQEIYLNKIIQEVIINDCLDMYIVLENNIILEILNDNYGGEIWRLFQFYYHFEEELNDLPKDYVAFIDNNGKTYFLRQSTRKTII